MHKVLNDHPMKEKAIEICCHELIRLENRFDLTYNNRYDQVVRSAANDYARKIISHLEEKAKSPAEMARIKKQEQRENLIQDVADGKIKLSDEILEELK